jgi:hypothetical protein
MPKLDDTVKAFIVQALACYDSPTTVADAVREEFGITVDRFHVARYDPTKVAGRDVAAKWRAMHAATRKAFLEDVGQIPIAQRAVRVRMLGRLVDKAVERKNAPLAAQLLEQVAKEVGGSFDARRRIEVTGKDGAPIPVQHSHDLSALTDDELAGLEAILAAAESRRRPA